jgi:hypothetical protein
MELMFDALYNLAVADDIISPDKYEVKGRPAIHSFPLVHPNRATNGGRRMADEL